MEDLVAAGRQEEVLILPVGIQYSFLQPPWQRIAEVMSQLEQDAGVPLAQLQAGTSETVLYQRLITLTLHLLGVMESFYGRSYGQPLPAFEELDTANLSPNQLLETRLHRLMTIALGVAENFFAVKAKGTLVDRCRRLEQAAWDRMFPDNLSQLSPVERGLADWLAQEASLYLGHMRLVERFTAVTGNYILENPTADRFAEVILLLWKVTTWMKGEDPNSRSLNLGQRRAIISIAEPISVTERWSTYQSDRRSAKQAVSDLTQDLQVTLEKMIIH